MDNIKISIGISNLLKSVNVDIDYQKGTAKRNNKKFNIDVKPFVSRLFDIVSSWQPEMVNSSFLDGTSYYVHIIKDGRTYNYNGQNKFPANFDEFLYLLKEAEIWK